MSEQMSLLPSMSSSEDSPAPTYPWPAVVKAWLEKRPDSSSSSYASLLRSLPVGWSSKTSMASCRLTEDGTWEPSSERWGDAGFGGPTVAVTLNGGDHPSDGAASFLSDILEPHVHQRFFLSPKACRGLILRAARRGKALPELLESVLRKVAEEETQEDESA